MGSSRGFVYLRDEQEFPDTRSASEDLVWVDLISWVGAWKVWDLCLIFIIVLVGPKGLVSMVFVVVR